MSLKAPRSLLKSQCKPTRKEYRTNFMNNPADNDIEKKEAKIKIDTRAFVSDFLNRQELNAAKVLIEQLGCKQKDIKPFSGA